MRSLDYFAEVCVRDEKDRWRFHAHVKVGTFRHWTQAFAAGQRLIHGCPDTKVRRVQERFDLESAKLSVRLEEAA